VITVTGWTWEHIDNLMTLPRLNTLLKYWHLHPPVHLTMAAYVGYEAPKDLESTEPGPSPSDGPRRIETRADFDEFVNCFTRAGGVVG
jgi:hypothetical protein